MKQFKRIFIIGHSGAGKSLLGKTLADKMGWKFIDADFGLEMHFGLSLNEIIGEEGKKLLHDREHEILIGLKTHENIVVVTDSGIVCNSENRKILSSEMTVYLKVSTPQQLERTLRNPEPLLLRSDLKTFFDKLHDERDHLYDEVATLILDGDKGELNKHVTTIINTLTPSKEPTDALLLDKRNFIFYHRKKHTPVRLSRQQALCLKLLAQGKNSKEIAKIMNISFRTVEKYIANIAEKLGCSSSKELISIYFGQP